MEFESMENSSQTAPPISKTTVDATLTHGPTATTLSPQELSGSSQTLIAGASTAGTSARFLPLSFNIGCDPCGHFLRKCLNRSASLPLLAGITSAVAWSGHLATIPLALLAPVLMYKAQSRSHAYALLFCYYVGASWPLIPGASAFFGGRGSVVDGILLCFGTATLLAIPAAILFTRNRTNLPYAIAVMFILTAIPPLGIIGWGSPFLSAGVLFPGTAWLGLIFILALIPLLGHFRLWTAALVAILAVVANSLYDAPALPAGWKAVNTQFGGAGQGDPDFLSEFNAHEQMQETIRQSNARLLLFPEHVVTQWNEATEAFWHESLQNAANRHAMVLIGAGLPRTGAKRLTNVNRYYNALIVKGQETRTIYYQRIPVPLTMWKPLADDGVPLNIFGPGTIPVQNQRAAVLICYEEFLVWPFLSSAFERPTILITVANDYWAKRTPIPKIQDASAASWARLFGLPMLSAVND